MMAGIDSILCSRAGGRIRAALMAEGRLAEMVAPASDPADSVGSVLLGRVRALMPGLEAAFVDIGAQTAGFLSLARRPPPMLRRPEPGPAVAPEIEPPSFPPLCEGDSVLVQVTKAPQAGKGAGLTRAISLAGRYLVLTPFQPGLRVSRRILDPAFRAEAALALAGELPQGGGLIVRTVADSVPMARLVAEAGELADRWRALQDSARQATPPACLHAEGSGLAAILRDHVRAGLRRVRVDAEIDRQTAATFLSEHGLEDEVALELWAGPEPLFVAFGIDDALAEAGEPLVPLPCGGSLVIEGTAALTAIDVNSGRNTGRGSHAQTILETNLEAAREIAFQLRLRRIGGLVVVDFIHMDRADHREKVLEAFTAALKDDPELIAMTEFSTLGLVELARRRGQGPLNEG